MTTKNQILRWNIQSHFSIYRLIHGKNNKEISKIISDLEKDVLFEYDYWNVSILEYIKRMWKRIIYKMKELFYFN